MRPTAAEAEWAMRAIVIDRLGDDAGLIAVEGVPPRRGDPPNIRRLRVAGPGEAMAKLEREIEPIAAGASPPASVFARMKLAVSSAVARARATAERSRTADHAAKVRAGIAKRRAQ